MAVHVLMRAMCLTCVRVVAGAVVVCMCRAVIVAMVVVVGVRVVVSMVAVAVIGHMAAVSTAFRLKSQISLYHGHVHAAQHVGQHMVGFDLQVIGLQLYRHMAVAQVVGGAHQIKRAAVHRTSRDVQHFLRRCNDAHHRAIFGHQHITTAHCLATGQEHCQFTALVVGSGKAGFLTDIPIELHGGSAFQQNAGQALALGKEFVHGQHGVLTFQRSATSMTSWRALCIRQHFVSTDSMPNMSTPSELSFPTTSDWLPCGVNHVAVYGTLRAGGVNEMARLRPGIISTGRTTLTGSLHDLGWYPGLILQGTQQVLAEVYPLDHALEQVLDGYEGIWPQNTGEYTKRIVTLPVALTSGSTQMMALLVYEALPATVQHAPVIAASDWLAWHQAKGVPSGPAAP